MTKSKGYSKRPGAQKVQTKRSPMNKHNHEKHTGYAKRMLERAKFFKLKLQERFR